MSSVKVSENIRVRLVPMYPLSIMFGGLELQCLKSCTALQNIGVSAELLDTYHAEDEFDVLHLFASTPNYYDICRHAKQPIVISAVSNVQSLSPLRAFAYKSVSYLTHFVGGLHTYYHRLRSVYNAAEMVICLNQFEARYLEGTYGVPKNRLSIISNGVSDNYFNASRDLFIEKYGVKDFVLFTGSIIQRKNPLLLAEVLQHLGFSGVFIGSTFSSEREYGEAFANVIKNSPNLLWISRLNNNDPLLASAYAAARLFCLPSYEETQSISALEAMSTGTPVILGDFPYAYQIPFERTLKCNPSNKAELCKFIQLAMNEPEKYSIQLSDNYRWQNIALEIAEVYRQVLTKKY